MTDTSLQPQAAPRQDASQGAQQVVADAFSMMRPRNLGEAIKFAELVAESDLAPKEYRGKTGNCLIAMQMGMELGMPPLMALQNISVINGRATVWGDLMLAICRNAQAFGGIRETLDAKTMTARCEVWRKDGEPVVHTFSVDDAKLAKLWDKAGPWQQYPKRMLQMRARSWALRDTFPAELKGLISREEAMDFPTVKDARGGQRTQRPVGQVHDAALSGQAAQGAPRQAAPAGDALQDAQGGRAPATLQQVLAAIANASNKAQLEGVRDMGAGLTAEEKQQANEAYLLQAKELHREAAARQADANVRGRGNDALMQRLTQAREAEQQYEPQDAPYGDPGFGDDEQYHGDR